MGHSGLMTGRAARSVSWTVVVMEVLLLLVVAVVATPPTSTNTTTTTTTTTAITTTITSDIFNPVTDDGTHGDDPSSTTTALARMDDVDVMASTAPSDQNLTLPNSRVTLFMEVRPQVISVDKYVSIIIYCIGFPGNILSFVVWLQKRMRHSSGCYLAALALDDFIFLSLHVIFDIHMVWEVELLNTPVVCQFFPIVFLAAQYLGPLLVLGFTTERYISICHPFKREKYCTVRRAKIVIGVLVASALGLSSVQGYFYTMQESLAVNGTYECGPRPEVSLQGNTSLLILWNLSIEILTFLLVPLAVLVLNVLVISEMRRLSRTEQVTLHGGGHSQRTSATTVMLLAVSFYLILTTLPVTIAYTLFYEFDYDMSNSTSYNATIQDPAFKRWVSYELVLAAIREFGTTQYAFNIIFYVITGKIFRKELKRLFGKVLCRKISMSISKEYSSLRSSFRRDGSKTATSNTWVSINGHSQASSKLRDTTETKV